MIKRLPILSLFLLVFVLGCPAEPLSRVTNAMREACPDRPDFSIEAKITGFEALHADGVTEVAMMDVSFVACSDADATGATLLCYPTDQRCYFDWEWTCNTCNIAIIESIW